MVQPNVCNKVIDENGRVYGSIRELAKAIHRNRSALTRLLNKNGCFVHNGIGYTLYDGDNAEMQTDESGVKVITIEKEKVITVEKEREDEEEYQEFKKSKSVKEVPFQIYKFGPVTKSRGYRYAVALFSDAHIEEKVTPESVNYLNEYNISIAEERIETYFRNLASCLEADQVEELIFASLGDTISGYIHDELAQTNELSPLEATFKAQSLIYSGLKYLCEDANLKKLKKIRFIGIVGNHSRTTKKIQHSNGFKMSYEWLMYQNIKKQCELTGLRVEFYIPESELAIVNTADNKTFIFMHGFQIKSGGTGTVCGIYPALNRLVLKYSKVFKQDMIFLGHFHSTVNTPNSTVNGSIISYNTYALTNGFEYERPQQQYICYDTELGGQLLTRQIYCN
jgi:hypothetical protein